MFNIPPRLLPPAADAEGLVSRAPAAIILMATVALPRRSFPRLDFSTALKSRKCREFRLLSHALARAALRGLSGTVRAISERYTPDTSSGGISFQEE